MKRKDLEMLLATEGVVIPDELKRKLFTDAEETENKQAEALAEKEKMQKNIDELTADRDKIKNEYDKQFGGTGGFDKDAADKLDKEVGDYFSKKIF